MRGDKVQRLSDIKLINIKHNLPTMHGCIFWNFPCVRVLCGIPALEKCKDLTKRKTCAKGYHSALASHLHGVFGGALPLRQSCGTEWNRWKALMEMPFRPAVSSLRVPTLSRLVPVSHKDRRHATCQCDISWYGRYWIPPHKPEEPKGWEACCSPTTTRAWRDWPAPPGIVPWP